MNNIKSILLNIYENYQLDLSHHMVLSYKYKCLGMMEGYLILLNKLDSGQPYQFNKIIKTFNFLWIISITYSKTENYEEHILRLVYEALIEEN